MPTRNSVRMGLGRVAVIATILFYIFALSNACPSRRRSPSCYARDCTYNNWGRWSSCTAQCGYVGIKTRTRTIRSYASCGGRCSNILRSQTSCPNTCCPIDCRYSWLSWSACDVTCGYGTRSRTMRIISSEKCGGRRCPTTRTQTSKCGNGR